MTMAGASAAKSRRRAHLNAGDEHLLDRELEDLPPDLRWREWMLRVEAVIFAAAEPVSREVRRAQTFLIDRPRESPSKPHRSLLKGHDLQAMADAASRSEAGFAHSEATMNDEC